MPELPGRPNLDQLRRQARELLRAAADGEPAAQARIRAFSEQVSLSAAQLTVAREYGLASWPALHAEVERRLAALPAGAGRAGRAETSWSFGGACAVETAAGTLYPGGLVAGAGHAFLDAALTPTQQAQERLAEPPPPISSSARAARGEAIRDLAKAIVAAVALTDDQGTTYALHVADLQHDPGLSQERGPVALRLGVDPVPARERGWLELRGHDGSAARLVPSARAYTRVSHLSPTPYSAEAWVLSQEALWLIGLQFVGAGRDEVERQCSAALARVAEIQQRGGAGDLPGQLARLCAALTGHGPADGLPRGWSGMLDAADLRDGASRHLDLAVALPRVDDTVVRVDSLMSEPGTWRVHLRAEPGWWGYSADRNRKWAVLSVAAEDDLGGLYLSQFDGSRGHGDHEELTLRFLPRLNPLARALTLTFSQANEQATLELQLP